VHEIDILMVGYRGVYILYIGSESRFNLMRRKKKDLFTIPLHQKKKKATPLDEKKDALSDNY